MKKVILSFIAFVGVLLQLHAQLIISDPPFPGETDEVTITFNATEGNGGLAGYDGDVYAHTGVITSESTSTSDWKYVKTEWGENTPETKLERIGTDLYKITIGPSVREYYEVPEGESVLKMAFVFRSEEEVDGYWLEGKTADGSDIFVDMFTGGLNVQFIAPATEHFLANRNEAITFNAQALSAEKITLYINNEEVAITNESELIYDYTPLDYGKYYARVKANQGSMEVWDSVQFYVRPDVEIAEIPDGWHDGINYLDDNKTGFVLVAPEKDFVFLLSDFNQWEFGPENYMKRTSNGKRFWIELDGLNPDQAYLYQYYVDAELKIGDPYAELILDPWNDKYIPDNVYPNRIEYPEGKTTGIVSVFYTQREAFDWDDDDFSLPWETDLVIYELLVRDFATEHSYQKIIDKLDYLQQLGINAIELMPVIEFDGNDSWGYGPSYFFAPDKYYGTPHMLKTLINECHKRDMVVIMDLVLNHATGNSPLAQLYWDAGINQTAEDNPWFNVYAPHPMSVFHDFDHSSTFTQNYVKRVLEFWLEEYHFDGYRLDLSKGITQKQSSDLGQWSAYDDSRVQNLKRIAQTVKTAKPGAYVILEHFADNDEERALAESGMMLWGNMDDPYSEASMGYNGSASDLSWGYYGNRGWSQPALVTFMESHDEERQMYKNVTYGNCGNPQHCITDTATALKRSALAAAFFFTYPGPKMIWQFEELGYDYSINWPTMTEDSRTAAKPPRWDYQDDPDRAQLYHTFSQLMKLRHENDIFKSPYTQVEMDVVNEARRIKLTNSGLETGKAIVIGNFGVNGRDVYPNFHNTGTWFNALTGEAYEISSTTSPWYLEAGEFVVFTENKTGTWVNLQYPAEYTALPCEGIDVYAQVFVGGRTSEIGQAEGIRCWIGVSEFNNEPWNDNWDWQEAVYNGDRSSPGFVNANDEYVLSLPCMEAGNYYYASRFEIDGQPYVYGGVAKDGTASGGFWDGSANVSGKLTVSASTSRKWYVSASGTAGAAGTQSDPLAGIQEAVDRSSACDSILVADGTYNENVDMSGKNVLLASMFAVDGNEGHIASTIISGGNTGPVLKIHNGENHACHIMGLTLTEGNASGEWPDNSGGALQVFASSPLLSNLIISNSTAQDCGGGVFFHDGGNAIMENCIVQNNISSCAAGIGVNAATVRINNSRIQGNEGNWGTAMSIWDYSSCQLVNCSINGQVVQEETEQPLIYSGENSVVLLSSSEIVQNKADKILELQGSFIIDNLSLAGNQSKSGAVNPALMLQGTASSLITNSILRDIDVQASESILMSYSNIEGGFSGTANIDADPLFANPDEGNFRLTASSTCVDAANPGRTSSLITDLGGSERIWDGNGDGTARLDMGAWEFGSPEEIFIGRDTSICEGESIRLDAGAGYVRYDWNDGLASTRYLEVWEEGRYTLIAERADGSMVTGSIFIEVAALPVPQIPEELWLCPGENATLDAGSGFASYHWADGIHTQKRTITKEGTYSLYVTSFKGCESPLYSCIVERSSLDLELGPDTIVCKEKSIKLDAGNPGSAYLWSTEEQSQTITLSSGGEELTMKVYCSITGPHGCMASDTINIVFKDCTGIEEMDAYSFIRLIPNPAHESVRLQFMDQKLSLSELYLLDFSGRILKKEIPAENAPEYLLDLNDVPAGIYLLRIISKDQQEFYLKLMKQ